ncbi:MAG: hypothetical protein J6U54_03485 [Clostridiales bacterium]|nr:hypothetical protein [Clostridiales bacterium]
MSYVLIFFFGMAVGIVAHALASDKKPSGILKMDHSTGDPYLFLELHDPIDTVLSMDDVVFKVDHSRDINNGSNG